MLYRFIHRCIHPLEPLKWAIPSSAPICTGNPLYVSSASINGTATGINGGRPALRAGGSLIASTVAPSSDSGPVWYPASQYQDPRVTYRVSICSCFVARNLLLSTVCGKEMPLEYTLQQETTFLFSLCVGVCSGFGRVPQSVQVSCFLATLLATQY